MKGQQQASPQGLDKFIMIVSRAAATVTVLIAAVTEPSIKPLSRGGSPRGASTAQADSEAQLLSNRLQ